MHTKVLIDENRYTFVPPLGQNHDFSTLILKQVLAAVLALLTEHHY